MSHDGLVVQDTPIVACGKHLEVRLPLRVSRSTALLGG
jgi:hypothetical protein